MSLKKGKIDLKKVKKKVKYEEITCKKLKIYPKR